MPALEGAPRSRRASSRMGTAPGGRPWHSDDIDDATRGTPRRDGDVDVLARDDGDVVADAVAVFIVAESVETRRDAREGDARERSRGRRGRDARARGTTSGVRTVHRGREKGAR